MRVETLAPDPRLAHIVERYHARTATLGSERALIPLPARTDVLIEFYFTLPHLVEHRATGRRDRAPRSVGVGPQSFQAATLILTGDIDVFTVRLRPTALYELFGVPMPHLTNGAVDLADLLGPQPARELHERLAEAGGFRERAQLMDLALLPRLRSGRPGLVATAAERLRRTHGAQSVEDLARSAGQSERQFRRLFTTQIGIAPKLYGRIVRLTAALDAKATAPQTSWTEIAHTFGWFDQAHLDKDFRALAGASPSAFARPAAARG